MPARAWVRVQICEALEAAHEPGIGICCMEGLPTSPFCWVGSREVLHELIGR